MEHLFIAPANTFSPRWQQAFSEARIVAPNEAQGSLSAPTLVWLLLEGESWHQVLTGFLVQGIKVIAMTRDESPEQARRAIATGASGYVHYLAVPSLLQQVAQAVKEGGMWLGADLMRQLMTLAVQVPPAPVLAKTVNPKLALLTPRELAVAEAVAAGKTNKEAARLLDITERTVKAHLGAVFEKLGVRDRLQLALTVAGKV